MQSSTWCSPASVEAEPLGEYAEDRRIEAHRARPHAPSAPDARVADELGDLFLLQDDDPARSLRDGRIERILRDAHHGAAADHLARILAAGRRRTAIEVAEGRADAREHVLGLPPRRGPSRTRRAR